MTLFETHLSRELIICTPRFCALCGNETFHLSLRRECTLRLSEENTMESTFRAFQGSERVEH
jgi:hypothetical protein